MELKPPTPVCKTFAICRQIVQDKFTQEYMLLGVSHEIFSLAFPAMVSLSFHARCTSLQGLYHLELRLEDLEGNKLWHHQFDPPLEYHDPLKIGVLNLQSIGVYFSQPGKYDLVLLANGDEVVRHVFWAHLHGRPVA